MGEKQREKEIQCHGDILVFVINLNKETISELSIWWFCQDF